MKKAFDYEGLPECNYSNFGWRKEYIIYDTRNATKAEDDYGVEVLRTHNEANAKLLCDVLNERVKSDKDFWPASRSKAFEPDKPLRKPHTPTTKKGMKRKTTKSTLKVRRKNAK